MRKHIASSFLFLACSGFAAYAAYLAVITGMPAAEPGILLIFAGLAGVAGLGILRIEYGTEISKLRMDLEAAQEPDDLSWGINTTASGGIAFHLGDLTVVCDTGPDGLVMKVDGLSVGKRTFIYTQSDEPELAEPSDDESREEE